ncbi:uncharacterized protein [Nicotiana sylvestris]|uniref:uncharacterized protein n=1 Tax=Nicotiana sylvestris TaxID=4096 RepID=UPI00388C8627
MAMVAAWGESSDDDDDDDDNDDDDERALMAIGESDEETEVSVLHLKDKINFLSKERLSELILELIDESDDVHELGTTVLELRSENLKLKLGIGKKTADHTQLTLEENIGKMKYELHKRDVRILEEDLSKVKHELDRTCKWNRSSDALSWLQEHHSSNKRGLGFGNPSPKWDPKSKYLTLSENKICTHCDNTGHYKVQVKGSSQIWYMDSGCSKHMTESKNQFLSLEDLKGGNVSFRNGKKGDIIGVGKVGKTDSHSIKNVYLIDGLKYSLISISQLCDRVCGIMIPSFGTKDLDMQSKPTQQTSLQGLPNIKFKEDKVCEAYARGKQEVDWVNAMQDELN